MQSPSLVDDQSPALTIEEPYKISVREWVSKDNKHDDYKDNNEPPAVFNVLDMVLVHTMERMKKLRSVCLLIACKHL